MEKILKTRIQHKIDTTANWTTAGNNGFVPLKGEIIFYSDGAGAFKVGDGNTNINNLPFATVNFIEKQNNTLGLPRAYAAKANSSEVELITINESPTDASIARRGTGGRLQVGTPTATNHAATKEYVDNGLASKVPAVSKSGGNRIYGTDPNGNQKVFAATTTNYQWAVPLRGENYTFSVGEPTDATHPATKNYVDDLREEMLGSFSYTVGDGIKGINGDLHVTVDRSNEIASVKLVDDTANAIESISIPEFWCVDTDDPSPDNYLSFKRLIDHDGNGQAIARREFYVYNDVSTKCPGECDIILSGLSEYPTALIFRDGISDWIVISYSGGRIVVKTQEYDYWQSEFLLHFDVRLVQGRLLIKAEKVI